MPSVRTIGNYEFADCTGLTDAEFGKELSEIGWSAFIGCNSLRRIAIPLKDICLQHLVKFSTDTASLMIVIIFICHCWGNTRNCRLVARGELEE